MELLPVLEKATEATKEELRKTVEELATRFSEPAWLVDSRWQAWEHCSNTPFPTERDEGWRRTDIGSLDLSALRTSLLSSTSEIDSLKIAGGSTAHAGGNIPPWVDDALAHFEKKAGVLFQGAKQNGFYYLDPALKEKGVIFCDIATAVSMHADKLKPYLAGAGNSEEDGKFGLLTKALFNCGMFVYVPRGVEIKDPLIFALDLSGSKGEAILPRSLVVAEDMSKVTIVYALGPSSANQAKSAAVLDAAAKAASTSTSGLAAESESASASASSKSSKAAGTKSALSEMTTASSPAAHNPGLTLLSQYAEIHVKPSAHVAYLELQEYGNDVFMVNKFNCIVDRDGRYESLTLALGGRQTKSDMATNLRAPGATSEVLGIVLGANNEKFSFNTIQDHSAADTKSNIIFRTALKDKSSSIYQGIVRVAKVAQRTDAYQSNKNLLLDGTATADSIPKLEILADDVKCAHGATVGPVDREQIFYLMSRGITRQVAEQLIVLGFFRQTLERFPYQEALSWLSEAVTRKIQGEDSAAADFFEDFE